MNPQKIVLNSNVQESIPKQKNNIKKITKKYLTTKQWTRCASIVFCSLFLLLLAYPTPLFADMPEFQFHWNSPEGYTTTDVAWGDMDGDGDLDIAVSNRNAVNQLYDNDGTGNFTPRSLGLETSDSIDIAWGDMDGDGDLDLAVANWREVNQLYENDGTGNFTLQNLGKEVRNSTSVAWGDVNGDGYLDLAIGNAGDINNSTQVLQSNQVYENDGQGNFTSHDLDTNGQERWTVSVAWGDVNDDGSLDLAVGNAGRDNDNQLNQIYTNDGQGTLTPDDIPNDPGWSTASVAWGDMDGDGDLDLAVGNYGGNILSRNQIYTNDGDGGLTGCNVGEQDLQIFTQSITWGDMDNDGDLDLAIGTSSTGINENLINQIYENDGQGACGFTPRPLGVQRKDTWSIAWGDMDGDGDLDIATSNSPANDLGGTNNIYINDSQGNFVFEDLITEETNVRDIALGDMDGDGALDLAVGSQIQGNKIYTNNGLGVFTPCDCNLQTPLNTTESLAWGDMDSDGDLDLAVANNGSVNQLYRNDGAEEKFTLLPNPLGIEARNSTSIAWGDIDGDDDLDLAVGNLGDYNRLYKNDGEGNFDEYQFNLKVDEPDTESLIITVTNGIFTDTSSLLVTKTHYIFTQTNSMAWGDMDGDGDLDLAVGNNGINQVYENDGQGRFIAHDLTTEARDTASIAWGDMDKDGDLDLAVGNRGDDSSQVYENIDGRGNFRSHRLIIDTSGENTQSVAWGDIDGDSDLELVVGNSGFLNGGINQVYEYDGDGRFTSIDLGTDVINKTNSIALGDLDSDGDLDIISGNEVGVSQKIINNLYTPNRLPLLGSELLIDLHKANPNRANFYSQADILSGLTIPLTYTLVSHDVKRIGRVKVDFSINSGGEWRPAIPTEVTATVHLTASPSGQTYTFVWDTFESGFFGRSDNVVFRFQAYAQPDQSASPKTYTYINQTPSTIQQAKVSATTLPLRIRGTQIRVIREGMPVPDAFVYRIPEGEVQEGIPYNNANIIYQTNDKGDLRGYGDIEVGDTLVALAPITFSNVITRNLYITNVFRAYQTNAVPITTGVSAYTVSVSNSGIHTLTILHTNTLLLADLSVALEWDASQDDAYKERLISDLTRASELFYDWTNGQMALGDVTVYHDGKNSIPLDDPMPPWDYANIRIYASNQLRPSAALGGVVTDIYADVISSTSTITYTPGQVRMGAIWNRFGNADEGQNSEDWSRTLAHELGHYLLFLDDNYLGLNDNDLLTFVDNCDGVMSDPYRDDDESGFDEFYSISGDWDTECGNTLANKLTGREDWETITHFYPGLRQPSEDNFGPNRLPLSVTHIIYSPITLTDVIVDPFLNITEAPTDTERYIPSDKARAYLFQGLDPEPDPDQYRTVTDIGQPDLDRIETRGAQIGDRVCIFEPQIDRAVEDQSADSFIGCTEIRTDSATIPMAAKVGWLPDINLSPVTSTTIDIQVDNVPSGLAINAQLYPADSEASSPIPLNADAAGTKYIGSFRLDEAAHEVYVHIWVDEDEDEAQRREMIADYTIGGNPGFQANRGGFQANRGGFQANRGGFQANRGGFQANRGGFRFHRTAPVTSADGQAIIFGRNLTFAEGEFFTLQSTLVIPDPPSWVTQVGQAYRLITSPNSPSLERTSINIGYLGRDVPERAEKSLTIYFSDDNGEQWRPLLTEVDEYYNAVVAPIEGVGIYALMYSIEVPLTYSGWNLAGYPIDETRPVTEALASLTYSNSVGAIYGYTGGDTFDSSAWQAYSTDLQVPDYVNTLNELEFGKGYWISVTEPITWFLKDISVSPTPQQRRGPFLPPATYYGDLDTLLTSALTVTAHINGNDDVICGKSRTRFIDGKWVFAVQVDADSGDGCGRTDEIVSIKIGSFASDRIFDPLEEDELIRWQNARFVEVAFRAPTALPVTEPPFMPLEISSGLEQTTEIHMPIIMK